MKTYLAIALILGAFAAGPITIATAPRAASSAKECTDCGCSGAGSDGLCPMEKGKKCHCAKK